MGTALAIAAICAAGASIISALVAYSALHLGHRPSIWAIASQRAEDGDRFIGVQIHNAGPGVALDVVAARTEPTGRLIGRLRRSSEWAEHDRSPVIRTLAPGEKMPPSDREWLSVGPNRSGDDVLGVLVRYSDLAGKRWEVPVQLDSRERSLKARRVRRALW